MTEEARRLIEREFSLTTFPVGDLSKPATEPRHLLFKVKDREVRMPFSSGTSPVGTGVLSESGNSSKSQSQAEVPAAGGRQYAARSEDRASGTSGDERND
jgi:hypothetical protein